MIIQFATAALIIVANYSTIKPLYDSFFDRPKRRNFVDRMSRSCIGDGLKFHEQGEISGCPKHVKYVATLVNLKSQQDEQVWMCDDHFNQIAKIDKQRLGIHPWQNLPFPRHSPTGLLYPSHQFTKTFI